MPRSGRFAAVGVVVALAASSLAGTAMGQSPPTSPGAAGSPPSDGVVTVSDADGFLGAMAHAIAVGADGSLVMGGGAGPDPLRPDNAVAWHSVDGTSWTQAVLPDSAGLSAYGVTDTTTGWVAIVTQPAFGGGLVYTSQDGMNWKRGKQFGTGGVGAVISTPDGLLVSGDKVTPDGDKPTVWRSTNLKKWKELELPGSGSGADIAQVPSGATVVLVDKVGDNHDHTFSLARSDDGSSWEAVDFPVVAASADESVSAGDLGTVGDLFVQLANVRAGDVTTGSIWTSVDGSTWTKAYEAPGALSVVASGPTGIVVGTDEEIISADGITWEPAAQPGLKPGVAAAGLPDGRVFVADSGYGNEGPFTSAQVVPAPAGFEAPPPPSPGASTAPGASPGSSALGLGDSTVVGAWTVIDPAPPAGTSVSAVFGADGALTVTIDCSTAKGKKPPTLHNTFTTEGSTITTPEGSFKGSCKKDADDDFTNLFAFNFGMSTRPGTWSIDGDTLTITGQRAPGTLVLQRAVAP